MGRWRSFRRSRAVLVGGVVLLLAAVVSAVAFSRASDDDARAGLSVGWGGGEGDPACVYDAEQRTVAAELTIDGRAPRAGDVTVTVTAYADENTSEPVGSSSRSVHVEWTVHIPLRLIIPVQKAPHVDEDGVAACGLAVQR